ncbi:GGDEF domain-containing protein [Rhizobium grahamii]|uniref:diguanylate cyclase n=1 Tax=Rhizobium grahamii TaxID=1120045 RepID=A0A5Q0CE74_9HYPH|nr:MULTISPECIES: GGDEF domain-containing protein [Rhizobium]QFY62257.1 GGDEF domain-containing protein [Rhizobium grahamii]QRM48554.1 GGDEF domain-containing protein [Rhizobium sp. BG6]
MNLSLSDIREKFSASLTFKIFAICFLSTHVPLLALVAYLVTGFRSEALPVLLLVLAATLVGTILCLASVWRLIKPLHQVANVVEAYRSTGAVQAVHSSRKDEIGVVTNGISVLIGELDATLSQLRRQATTDVLTGLGNRRWLKEIASLEVNRAQRERTPLSVVVFDLDHFKQINDQFGHDVGDQVLMMTGATIQHCLRPYDIAARIGGEEFCLVLPRTDVDAATAIADRLRTQLESKMVGPLPKGRVTASFGVYHGDPNSETLKTMLTEADRKLYAAKNAGRNRVHAEVAPSIRDRRIRA